jgi:hypothetical protein
MHHQLRLDLRVFVLLYFSSRASLFLAMHPFSPPAAALSSDSFPPRSRASSAAFGIVWFVIRHASIGI